jgi:hypothetical protein
MDLGVFAIQSSMLNVVLLTRQLRRQRESHTCKGNHAPDFVEIAIVKGQKVLVFVIEAVDGVCLAFGEIPNVAVAQLVHLVLAVLVHRRHEDATCIDEAPLRLAPSVLYKPLRCPTTHSPLYASAARA